MPIQIYIAITQGRLTVSTDGIIQMINLNIHYATLVLPYMEQFGFT